MHFFMTRTRQNFFFTYICQFSYEMLNGPYDSIFKDHLCIWCNRICWHAFMFKNTFFKCLIFLEFLYAPPLSNVIFSTKPLLPTVCPNLPADPVHCDWPNTTSVGNLGKASLTITASFKVNIKAVNNVVSFTICSSPRGEQSRATDGIYCCNRHSDDARICSKLVANLTYAQNWNIT